MRFLKLTLAYDGTAYVGWQVQPNGTAVQEVLEHSLQKITGVRTPAVASGRTDAGVHALGQVVSIATECELPCEVLQRALNANLPRDIAVLEVCEAAVGFHAIRDARRKRYRYWIQDGAVRDVFARNYCWWISHPVDEKAMHRAGQGLCGRHDFASFQTSGSDRASTVRTVSEISVVREPHEPASRIRIEIEADGFLYNMVRAIVGTLVEVGRGAQAENWPAKVLAARDRRVAGMTAPPQGLFLVRVDYDPETNSKSPGPSESPEDKTP